MYMDIVDDEEGGFVFKQTRLLKGTLEKDLPQQKDMEGTTGRRSGTDAPANIDSDTSSLLLNSQCFVLNSFLSRSNLFLVCSSSRLFLFTTT